MLDKSQLINIQNILKSIDKFGIDSELYLDICKCLSIFYIYHIKSHKYTLNINCSNDILSGGLFCFISLMILYPHSNKNILQYTKDALEFTTLYLYIDNIMDDCKVTMFKKTEMIQIIGKVLNGENNGKTLESYPEYIQPIIRSYYKINNPNVNSYIKKLFMITIESFKIQTSNCNRQTYIDICKKKGGYMYLACKYILDLNISDEKIFNLGACIQIVDDIVDANEDIDNGINTIVTYDINKEKYIDELLYDAILEIKALPGNLAIFKYILIKSLTRVIGKRDYFTNMIKRRFPTASHSHMRMEVNNFLKYQILND